MEQTERVERQFYKIIYIREQWYSIYIECVKTAVPVFQCSHNER